MTNANKWQCIVLLQIIHKGCLRCLKNNRCETTDAARFNVVATTYKRGVFVAVEFLVEIPDEKQPLTTDDDDNLSWMMASV